MIDVIFTTMGLPDPFIHAELYDLEYVIPKDKYTNKPKGFGRLGIDFPKEAQIIFQMVDYDTTHRIGASKALEEYNKN